MQTQKGELIVDYTIVAYHDEQAQLIVHHVKAISPRHAIKQAVTDYGDNLYDAVVFRGKIFSAI